MPFDPAPLAPGMLHDAACRLAVDLAAGRLHDQDPIALLGWSALLVPEQRGGAGAGIIELAALIEPLGAAGVDLPIIERCALAPLWLGACTAQSGSDPASALAAGESAPLPLTALRPSEASARAQGADAFVLTGHWQAGVDDPYADHLLLPARIDQTWSLFRLSRDALAGLSRFESLDGRGAIDLTLDGFRIGLDQRIGRGAALERALGKASLAAMLLTAVDSLGAIGAAIRQTIAYLDQRKQFGVALSSFQVLRHRVVECYVMYEAARGNIIESLRAFDHGADTLEREVRLTKCYLDHVARIVAHTTIQLHGAMGMSEDTPAARLAKRLLANEFRHGDRLEQMSALGAWPLTSEALA